MIDQWNGRNLKPPFSKFPSYYEFQLDALDKVRASRKKVTFIDGPPGSGKSLLGMSLCYDYQKSIYLATTKPLQQQIVNDFPEPEAIMLQGRANYPCVMSTFTKHQFPELTCEDCFEHDQDGEGISCKGRCLYQLKKKQALASGIAILNTSYYLTETNFVGRFSGWKIVVVDECDLLERAILNFVELNISDRLLTKLKLSPPEYKTKWQSWKEWADPVSDKLADELSVLQLTMKLDSPKDDIRYFRRIKSLAEKVRMFAAILDDSWIYQETSTRGTTNYSFKPTWISDIAKKYFWDNAERFVLMSGTPPLPKTLGLEQSEWDWVEVPNQFDPKRRPVFYMGVANLTAKTMEEERPKIIPAIKDILSKYPDKKGLIHTVSYNLSNYIIDNINTGRLVYHQSGIGKREELLKMFRASTQPLVVVSPSMDRGIDLPFDLCRFIICVKLPYPDLGDKQTAKRLYSGSFGQFWYRSETARTLVQMSMRGMRNIDDQCDCWIIDSQFEQFYSKSHDLFQDWWRASLEIVDEPAYPVSGDTSSSPLLDNDVPF